MRFRPLGFVELDGDVGLQPRDVCRLHGAAQIDRQERVGGLKLDELRHHPIGADALRHGDTDHAGRVERGLRGPAKNIEAQPLHLAYIVHDAAGFFRQLQAGLVANKKFEIQLLFEPVDGAHHGRVGDAHGLGRPAETAGVGADQKQMQIFP